MITSVEKAVRILQELDLEGDWVGVRELARRLNLSPAQTHNLLRTLVSLSLVETDPGTRRYRLGLGAIRMGAGSDPLNTMRRFARPYIESFAEEFNETTSVVTWQNDQAIVVDWIQAAHPLAVSHNHGVIDHPVVFASGRVVLAYQDLETQRRYARTEKLAKCGPNSPRTAKELLALLQQIAADGYAVAENVANSGVIALGAPVFDGAGHLLFAIGCSSPISRTSAKQVGLVRDRLLQVTSTMTERMRGRSGPPVAKDRAAAKA